MHWSTHQQEAHLEEYPPLLFFKQPEIQPLVHQPPHTPHYKKYIFWQQFFLLQVAGKIIQGSFASDL
jgi:hypothetical protein